MAIPPSTREQLIEAIAKFDRDYRSLPEFSSFDSKKSQKYALEFEGRTYPPKMIIHLATGIERRSFNGGEESNNYLKKYGFEVNSLSTETRFRNINEVITWIINRLDGMEDKSEISLESIKLYRIEAITTVAQSRIRDNPKLHEDYHSTIMSQIRRSFYDNTQSILDFDEDLYLYFMENNDRILTRSTRSKINNPSDYDELIDLLEYGRMILSGGIDEQSRASTSSKGLDYYLSHKPQIILAGPPGTSKTWSAREYVEKQLGARRFEKAENEYAGSYWSIVQFHPSYGYEDFISGVKAETVNGNLTFEQKKGIFLKMAIAAKQNPDNNYYLIIDEINRGVLGRIFGELILTLEYRGLEVHLPDEDEPLNIPENLYLIGTMNTADRNIALVDHALRRRFLIVEMLPDATQINDYHDTKKNSNKIRNLTLEAFRITQNAFYKTGTQEYDPDMNGYNMQDYAVGHTYFMADNNDQLSMNIKHQVIPLLGEYQREGVITKAAFEKVKSELSNFI